MAEHYPFQKTALPYQYTDLAPRMAPATLFLHHARLLAQDVDSLNQLLARYPRYQDQSLEQLISGDLEMPETDRRRIQNLAGSVYGHRLFFGGMAPPGTGGLAPRLTMAIEERYGSMAAFQELFRQAGRSIFGAGWAWLNTDPGGALHIAITSDNETPELELFAPVLTLDMWEHAYFLQSPADPDRYIRNWFSLVNWAAAEEAYVQAMARPGGSASALAFSPPAG